MSLVQKLRSSLTKARVSRFSHDEKRALLRLLDAVYLADKHVSVSEVDELQATADELGASLDDIRSHDVAWAMKTLRSGNKIELCALYLADAFFADGDFDAKERAFVDELIHTYGVPEESLRAALKAVQQRKLDEAVAEWAKATSLSN